MYCLVTVLVTLLYSCHGYKVLLLFPIPGRSHSILGEGYVNNLLEAGHEVTYITPLLMKNSSPRLKQIDISENVKYFSAEIFDVKKYMYKELDIQDQLFLNPLFNNFLYKTLETDAVQKFIHDPSERYDAVVVEWLYSDLGAGLASVFNCPLIWSVSMTPNTFMVGLIDDYFNPAYTLYHQSKDMTMSMWQKVRDLWTITRVRFSNWLNIEKRNKEFKKLFSSAIEKRGYPTPDFQEVKYNASLILGNSDVIMSQNVALPQNYKHIGGYHINSTIPPLSKDLKYILDEAKQGFIYFSLGSMLNGRNIPKKKKRELLDVFSSFNQTVIWKFNEAIPDLPKNVHIIDWAPQLSVLAHKNCVVFITHGGLLSLYETLTFGIPIIGMPFYGDQFLNLHRVAINGFGKRVDFDENAPKKLKRTIEEVLEDPSYRHQAKKMSAIFKDRMIPPAKELVHWIEHAIRTEGAPHLRSAAVDVSWYKKLFIDVLAVLTIALTLIVILIRRISRKMNLVISLKKKKL